MVQKRHYFGTDGIRGAVGKHPITPDFMLKLGWAAGRVLAQGGESKVLIGKDTRISGYMFESALEAGLSAAGVDIHLLGPMPTPAIAYLTQTFHAAAGIVISASHNPFADNGIKFFGADGMKLPDAVELAIEAELEQEMFTVGSRELGKAERIADASGRYIEFCKSTVPLGMNFKGMKVVVDCAHGACYHVAPSVFDELGADVVAIGARPDGFNINEQCGAIYPETVRQAVIAHQADLGIALDGDGDRVLMIDHQGEMVDGDELLFVIAESRHGDGQLNGTVVGTVMSNLGLEEALSGLGIKLQRAKVGDRYVLEMMKGGGWTLGGETSGHIICLDRLTTGDGIVAALQVLAAARRSDRPLHELKQAMTKHPQIIVNVRSHTRGVDITTVPAIEKAVKSVESELAGCGRVLLRPSGTEPLVRVMVEGRDIQKVKQLATRLAQDVEVALGQTAA